MDYEELIHDESSCSFKNSPSFLPRRIKMVGRTMGALSCNTRVETIEKKVVVRSALQKHGFMFHYKNGVHCNIDDGDDGA